VTRLTLTVPVIAPGQTCRCRLGLNSLQRRLRCTAPVALCQSRRSKAVTFAEDTVMHPNVERVTAALHTLGSSGAVRELSVAATTAALAAEALGVEVGAIANSLVFRSTEPVLVLASGRHRVDTAKVAALLRLPSLERADPAYVRAATGQTIGGVAPVGHPHPLRTVVDTALADYPVVWAAGGTAHTVFHTSYDELLRITGGTPAEVC